MKKKAAISKTTPVAKRKTDDIASLMAEVRGLIQSARRGVASVVDTFQVMTNFEIGRRIVEHEQQGAKRAAYGKELLLELSVRLAEDFGNGFSPVNLSYMKRFYLLWRDRVAIFQTPSEKLAGSEIFQTPSGELALAPFSAIPSRKSPFTLSWSHYVLLLTIKDPDERSFYEIEATNESWSLSELKRQKASSLYERLALSRDKEGIRKLAREGQVITKPEDLLKEPLVLEFLGLEERSSYSESDLEQSIIDRLEHFLLELGKGSLFVGRQRRIEISDRKLQPRSQESAQLRRRPRRCGPHPAGIRKAPRPDHGNPCLAQKGTSSRPHRV